MVLNFIWVAFFLLSIVFALGQWIFNGNFEVFSAMFNGLMDISKTGFEIALGLTGLLTFWLGIMKVGEKSGAIEKLARFIDPFFRKLFPEIPKGHPAAGTIMLNFAANMLGLDNAATPIGLKAMKEMQELNPVKDTASNAQIMFLVLNTSGLTLIPISIMLYRSQLNAANPSDVFIPILITTFCSTLVGLIAVSVKQKINLFNKTLFLGLLSLCLLISGIIYFFITIDKSNMGPYSSLIASVFIFAIMSIFIVMGLFRKINVFEVFIDGAKEGFDTAIKIIPYLVAILAAITLFRISGGMDVVIQGMSALIQVSGLPSDFVPSLPTAFMKPLSGSGARAMMLDSMNQYGADSFVGRLSCIFQGSVDTTLYIVAVYFGSVGVKKSRYAVGCGLIADLASIIAAIVVAYMFFPVS